MISVGDCCRDDQFINRIKEHLQNLIINADLRGKLSTKMQMMVDGNGADRIDRALVRKSGSINQCFMT